MPGLPLRARAALLAARKVAYIDPAAGGSSGIYFAKLLETMGIAEAVKAKAEARAEDRRRREAAKASKAAPATQAAETEAPAAEPAADEAAN